MIPDYANWVQLPVGFTVPANHPYAKVLPHGSVVHMPDGRVAPFAVQPGETVIVNDFPAVSLEPPTEWGTKLRSVYWNDFGIQSAPFALVVGVESDGHVWLASFDPESASLYTFGSDRLLYFDLVDEEPSRPVHNHGPDDGLGLGCRERTHEGRLAGECLIAPDPLDENDHRDRIATHSLGKVVRLLWSGNYRWLLDSAALVIHYEAGSCLSLQGWASAGWEISFADDK